MLSVLTDSKKCVGVCGKGERVSVKFRENSVRNAVGGSEVGLVISSLFIF